MRTAFGTRRTRLLAPLLALTLVVGLPAHGRAQHTSRAAVGAPHNSLRPPVDSITRLAVFPYAAAADSARRSPIPFLVGGALAGAAVGWLMGVSFRDSFCDEPRPGYSCSTTDPAVGALIGAGVGAFAGAILWTITTRIEAARRAGSR